MLLDFLHNIVRRRYRAMGFESRQMESSVGTLHYIRREHPGAAGTIVFVHGLGTSSSTWLKIFPNIRRTFRILALDLPGFGFSTVKNPSGYCGLPDHIRALEDFLGALGEDPIILVGHSLGGWIGAHYAIRHPLRIGELILVDAAGVYYSGVENLKDLFTLHSVKDTRRLLDNLWHQYPWYFKPFTRLIYRELTRRHINEIVASTDNSNFLGEELSSLTMPVSIVWGKEDRAIPAGSVDVFKKFIPNANTFMIEHCGHVPQLERPDEFASILNTVLGGSRT